MSGGVNPMAKKLNITNAGQEPSYIPIGAQGTVYLIKTLSNNPQGTRKELAIF